MQRVGTGSLTIDDLATWMAPPPPPPRYEHVTNGGLWSYDNDQDTSVRPTWDFPDASSKMKARHSSVDSTEAARDSDFEDAAEPDTGRAFDPFEALEHASPLDPEVPWVTSFEP